MNWSLVGTNANAFNRIFFNSLLFLGGGHGQQPATPISIMKKRSSNPIELRRSSGAVKVDLSSADKTIRRPGSEPDLNNSPIRSSLRQTASGKVEIFLEQREVVFLSPGEICENLNFSTVHL